MRGLSGGALMLLAACGGAVKGQPEASPPPASDGAGPMSEAAADGGMESRSAGCGAPAFAGDGSFKRHTLRVAELERSYHLFVPPSYDAQHPYPLIFRWHGSGGDGTSGGLGIEQVAGEAALVVGADGLEQRWSGATRAQDLALFDAMLAEIAARYCVDLARVYSYGFSAGGTFTNELACVRSRVLRAAAAIASGPSGGECTGATATWLLHDANDDAVPIALGRSARDRALAQNRCTGAASDAGQGCVTYQGCSTGEPVVYCETSGFGHDIRGDHAPAQVWQFFSQFR